MLSKFVRRVAIVGALAAASYLALPSSEAEAQGRYRRGGYGGYYRPVPSYSYGYNYRPIQSYRPVYVNPYTTYPAYRVPGYYNSYRGSGFGYGVGGYPTRPSYGGGGYPFGPSYGGGGFGLYIGR